jgi:small-conductance mechanosensitive channel
MASDETLHVLAIVGGSVGLAIVGTVVAGRIVARQERALATRYRGDFAGVRTRFRLVRRVLTALVVLISAIAGLEATPWGQGFSRTLLASGAVVAVITGFALRTPLANLAAGVQLALTQPFRLGDRVTVGELDGVVEEIKLSYTVLRRDDGRRVFLPNEQLIASSIVNATIEDPTRAEIVTVPVAHDADLAAIRRSLEEVAQGVPGRVADPAPTVRFIRVDEIAVTAEITAWVTDGATALDVGSELRARAVAVLVSQGALAHA